MVIKTSLATLLLLIIVFSFSIMTAFAADNVEWVEKQSTVQLYWGDSVTVDNYTVKAEDFSNDSVLVSITKDGKRLIAAPLSAGMNIEYNDEINVSAQEINPNYEVITADGKEFQTKNSNPYAELTISERGEPNFDIQVVTDKDTYDPKSGDNLIHVTINAENNGDAQANDVVMDIDTAGLELVSGQTEYTNSGIDKDESLIPINLTLKTPTPWEDSNFNIIAKITCNDIKNKNFEYESSKTINVEKKWDLIVTKAFPQERSLGESIPVTITAQNQGLCDIDNIVLNDSIASGMHLQENKTLNKTFSLKSKEEAENILEYSLVSEASGEFTIPSCTVAFTLPNGQYKEISSNNSGTVTIKEPDVKVTKTVDRQQLNVGDNLTIILTAQNNKDVNLDVKVNDTLPPGAKLIGGETSAKQILKSGGGSMSINYTIQMNTEGEIELPACKANFTDISKNSVVIASDTPIVNVVMPISLEENNTKKAENNSSSSQVGNNSSSSSQLGSTKGNKGITPGFDFIPSLIGFLAVSGLLRKKSF
jgi:uncharacterized repeat protein (TIGR01451 family)